MTSEDKITNEAYADTSCIRDYWFAWGVIVVLVTTGILLIRWLIPGSARSIAGYLIPVYMLATWLPIMVIDFIEGRRLMEYLKKCHFEKWKDLTYVPGFGSGGTNSFRALGFVYSEDNLSDPHVRFLKHNYRRVQLLLWSVFFSSPVLFLVIAII
jgi:hypothetical protein